MTTDRPGDFLLENVNSLHNQNRLAGGEELQMIRCVVFGLL